MIDAYLIGDKELVARLNAMPARVHASLLRRITALSLQLEARVKGNLSGTVLNVKTGALRRSVHHQVDDQGRGVFGIVGTYGIPYAKVHEYGFQGTVDVRAHLREIKQAFGRPISPMDVMVRQHTRQVNLPARSFIRSAFDDMRDTIRAELKGAVQEAIKT